MTVNTQITDREAKSFLYWLLGELDKEGLGFSYWYSKYLQTEFQKINYKHKEKRKCFGLYNLNLKICTQLCILRERCELVKNNGVKRCTNCGRPAMEKKKLCQYHSNKIKQWLKKTDENYIKAGKCISCGGFNDRKDKMAIKGKYIGKPLRTCSKCAELTSKRQKARYAQKQREGQ
jgi:hypothetical protein